MAWSGLDSPAAVLAAIKEYDLLGKEEFLSTYGFGSAREYLLLHKGRKYDSKAIAGVAHKYQFPVEGPLPHTAFSGGNNPHAAATKLASLGFKIVGLSRNSSDWTLDECQKTAKAYFQCLHNRLRGTKVNKAATYRKVSKQIRRAVKAVEYKFQNIDAILMEECLPRLGTSVAKNYQKLLRSIVRDFLHQNPHLLETPPQQSPEVRPVSKIFVPPPRTKVKAKRKTGTRKPPKMDFASRDAENKKLGSLGEQWVLKIERKRLTDAGRADLAKKVVWVSEDIGDGFGYDIQSFTATGKKILIEVKTTNGGRFSSFYITPTELAVAERERGRYRLYRVFDFANEPKIFPLPGPLASQLELTPISFRAAVGRN